MPHRTPHADAPDAPHLPITQAGPAATRVLAPDRFVNDPEWPPGVDPVVAVFADEGGPYPARPAGVADYVLDPLDRQDAATLLEVAEFAEDLAAHKAAEEYRETMAELDAIEDDDQVVDVEERGSGFIVTKHQQCGKAECSSCPHGPYRWRVQKEGGSARWTYLGKAGGSGE